MKKSEKKNLTYCSTHHDFLSKVGKVSDPSPTPHSTKLVTLIQQSTLKHMLQVEPEVAGGTFQRPNWKNCMAY
jgi:hypothetical protein